MATRTTRSSTNTPPKRRWQFLRFRPGVDYRHVNPVLLNRLNRLAMKLGQTIDIVSGARTVGNNTGASGSHHIPGNNPSGRGEAVDAYLNGRALASVVKEKTLARYGLYSGNRPGFYKGAPDPEHIETLERRGFTYKGNAGGAAPVPVEAPVGASQPLPQVPNSPDTIQSPMSSPPPNAPPLTTPPMPELPGSGATYTPRDPAEAWRMIAAQSLSSPESRRFAGLVDNSG